MLQTNHITSNIPLRHKHKNIIKAIKLCAEMGKRRDGAERLSKMRLYLLKRQSCYVNFCYHICFGSIIATIVLY